MELTLIVQQKYNLGIFLTFVVIFFIFYYLFEKIKEIEYKIDHK